MNNFRTVLWTSDLFIYYNGQNISFDKIIESFLEEEQIYSQFINGPIRKVPDERMLQYFCNEGLTYEKVDSFINYNNTNDYTGLMKGYALAVLRDYISKTSDSFIIDFGGDCLSKNFNSINFTYNGANIWLYGSYSAFASDNTTSKRGHHIFSDEPFRACLVTTDIYNTITGDMLATQAVAHKNLKYNKSLFKIYDVDNNNLILR